MFHLKNRTNEKTELDFLLRGKDSEKRIFKEEKKPAGSDGSQRK